MEIDTSIDRDEPSLKVKLEALNHIATDAVDNDGVAITLCFTVTPNGKKDSANCIHFVHCKREEPDISEDAMYHAFLMNETLRILSSADVNTLAQIYDHARHLKQKKGN